MISKRDKILQLFYKRTDKMQDGLQLYNTDKKYNTLKKEDIDRAFSRYKKFKKMKNIDIKDILSPHEVKKRIFRILTEEESKRRYYPVNPWDKHKPQDGWEQWLCIKDNPEKVEQRKEFEEIWIRNMTKMLGKWILWDLDPLQYD